MPRFVTQLTIFRVFFQVVVKLVEGDVACKFDGIGLHQILKRGLVNTQEVPFFRYRIFEYLMWSRSKLSN